MKEIEIEKYIDGIAFNIGEYEVAFYSNITKDIRYSKFGIEKVFPDTELYGCITIPFEENTFIIEEIKKYISAKNNNIAKG